jgi:Na+-translocating ferredoxin:NAD+ oxidoreductase subunit D
MAHMTLTITPAPHMTQSRTVRGVMGWVLVALLPVAFIQCYFFGPGLVVQFVLAAIGALAAEALALHLRRRPVRAALLDNSALVTAALLALSMPPLAPWWLVTSAAAFALLLGKHIYGGLGMNPFNPAMLGYAVLLVSFPKHMTAWLPATGATPDFSATCIAILTGHLPATLNVDVLSTASPLAALKSGLSLRQTMDEIFALPTFGSWAGRGWEWVSLGALVGGIGLLALRIIRWQIPVSMLLGLSVIAWLFNQLDPGRHANVMFHLFSGATMLGAFFIATDPVTAASSPKGRLIYGAGIGILTYVIRDVGNYHDGLAFAVLLMNMATPLIDKFTLPRRYGETT